MTEPEPSLPPEPDEGIAEERRVFDELGLEPCDWRALEAVPLLQMVWRDGRLDAQEVDRIRPVLQELLASEQDESWQHAARRKTFYDDLTRDGAARPEEQVRLARAAALLAWHLARHCGWTERTARLTRIRTKAEERIPRRQLPAVGAVLDDLAGQIDAFLAAPSFTETPQPAQVAPPEVASLGLADLGDWRPLLVAPLARLLGEVAAAHASLFRTVQDYLERELDQKDSVLREFLEGTHWFLALAWLCSAPADEGQPPARLAAAEDRLAQGLAGLPLARRRAVIDALTALAAQALGKPVWGLSPLITRDPPAQWNAILDRLHEKIDEERLRAGRAAVGAPEAPGSETPSVPAEPEARPAVVAATIAPPAPGKGEPRIVRPESFDAIGWDEVLALSAEIEPAEIEAILDRPLLFEEHRAEGERVCVVPAGAAVPESLWFVGDLHGDLLALANIGRYVERHAAAEGRAAHLVFLGDFIDRGAYGPQAMALFFRMLRDAPGRIGVVVGNHDEGAVCDPGSGLFRSTVQPSETVDQWNELAARCDAESRRWAQIGRLACRFFAGRSCAVFLPDGLLVAHGGFPHEDMLEGLRERADLSRRFCPQDFVWLRNGEAEYKYVYRGSKGCEFGYENFTAFCRVAAERLGIPVDRLVRGHDHYPARYQFVLDGANPILTLNAMCRKLPDEAGSELYPNCCVARAVAGGLPEIHVIPLPAGEITQAYYGRP